jgi:hypothetical protein
MHGRGGYRGESYTFVISNPASFLVSDVGVPCLASLQDYASPHNHQYEHYSLEERVSNMFVFTARGRLHLSTTPLPPPKYASPLKLKQATTKQKKASVKSIFGRVLSSKLFRVSRRILHGIPPFVHSPPLCKRGLFITS